MRYSANLNIIMKAVERAAARTPRDFIELENLQTNPTSASKFANACYNKVKQTLAEDLMKFRPDYNLIFSDGEKVIVNKDAEYSYTIFAIDGLVNLSRSSPHFTIAVALEHRNEDGEKESIAVAINNLMANEIYYCEKGFGAYASNRRLRVSKRPISDTFIVAAENFDFSKDALIKDKVKNLSPRTFGCRTLDISYLAAARVDLVVFKNNADYELMKPFTLLIREAGGKVVEKGDLVFASNGLIEL